MTQRPAILRLLAAGVLIAWVLPMSAGLVGDVRPKGSAGPASGFDPNGTYAPGEVLIKFRPEIPPAHRAAAMAVQRVRAIGRIAALDVYRVLLPEGTAVEEKAAALAADPRVLYAEPNYIGRASVTPNDNLFKYQYALSNIGQSIGDVPGSPQGKTGADIKATQGWEESQGDAAVTIAIVDSGVELTHPDLVGKIVGPGRDFVNDDYDASDDLYHRHGGRRHRRRLHRQRRGIAGVGWPGATMILPVKVLNDQGTGTVSQVADGIVTGSRPGAQVINLGLEIQRRRPRCCSTRSPMPPTRGCVLDRRGRQQRRPRQYRRPTMITSWPWPRRITTTTSGKAPTPDPRWTWPPRACRS